ncbi:MULTISPECIES: hypothetical protein [unclassified Methylobacterium]|uniref:hypothetical protein n=1 Tax=unclassified Methylobacterium TaxID=2615210 RepID=UPI002269BC4F|nr:MULTISPECIES: hypothetical protein [unclassified Methylobacterium]
MIDPKRPETDPAETPPGERAYEDLPVKDTVEGPRSPGATEPGDMGAPEGDQEALPHEHPRDDGKGYRGA